MSDDDSRLTRCRAWFKIRSTVLLHPSETKRELAEAMRGAPWYATARPFAIVQHWAPDLLTPITLCGRWADERSSSEIRTLVGWHCRKCQRRAKAELRRRKAAAAPSPVSLGGQPE